MKLHRRRGTRKVFYPITGDEGNRTPICALRTRRPAVERRPRLTHKDILHSIDLQLYASAPGNPLLSDARLTAGRLLFARGGAQKRISLSSRLADLIKHMLFY
jgi:hypothetical protein